MCLCVRAHVRACVRACVRAYACVRDCVRASVIYMMCQFVLIVVNCICGSFLDKILF